MKAKLFYQSKQVFRVFNNGFKKLIEQKSLNNYLWSKFRQQALIKTWFDNFKNAYAITRTEREINENKTVRNFREYMLKKRVLIAFKNIQIIESTEALKLQEHWFQNKMKNIFLTWRKITPQLRSENEAWEDRISLVIDRFRRSILGPQVIKSWKKFVQLSKNEKEKARFKNDIMSKVNGWLTELDEKHD